MSLTLRSVARVAVLLVGLAIAALLGLVAASHGDPAPAWRTPRPWSPPRTTAPIAAGMIVGIDPETGRLGMPTEAQRARIAASAATRAGSRPAPVHHLDGSVSLDTHEWMRDYAVIRTGPGGKLVFSCLDTRDAALRTMHAPVPPPAKEER